MTYKGHRMITPQLIGKLAPHCDAALTAKGLSEAAAEFGIADAAETAMWLGQLMVESAHFTRLEENLSYSAERLVQVWPKRFPTPADAEPYAHNPRGLAEKVYGGRLDLGNKEPGDGWKFRGRGYIQTTGRFNYEKGQDKLGVNLVADPDQLSQPPIAARAAAFYWTSRGLGPLAREGDIVAVTRIVNGGLNGLAERQAAYIAARDLISNSHLTTA